MTSYSEEFLYSTTSSLYTNNGNKSIGLGLFRSTPIINDELIAKFKGETITYDEALIRQTNGRGGYMVYITDNLCLDCYENAILLQNDNSARCYASMANSPLNVHRVIFDAVGHEIHVVENIRSNCNLMINRNNKTVSLRAKQNIEAHTEILYNYSANYFF